MAKSQQTFNKSEKEKKRLKKRKEKLQKQQERAAAPKSTMDDMIAYVDENGMLTDTPPDPTKRKKVKAENIELGVPKREAEEFDPIKKGKVDFFDHSKGFGFIKEQDTQEKFFVHINGCIDEIEEGTKVSFELEKGLKGLNAVRVKKA